MEKNDASAKVISAYVPSPNVFRQLEGENKQMKELLGEKDLDIAVLRDLLKAEPSLSDKIEIADKWNTQGHFPLLK